MGRLVHGPAISASAGRGSRRDSRRRRVVPCVARSAPGTRRRAAATEVMAPLRRSTASVFAIKRVPMSCIVLNRTCQYGTCPFRVEPLTSFPAASAARGPSQFSSARRRRFLRRPPSCACLAAPPGTDRLRSSAVSAEIVFCIGAQILPDDLFRAFCGSSGNLQLDVETPAQERLRATASHDCW